MQLAKPDPNGTVFKILGVALILFAAYACAENSAARLESEVLTATNRNFPPIWLGAYEPTGSARGPKVNTLTINQTTFTWGGCNDATIRQIAQSENEFVFEADPNAKCGWAGWIMELKLLVPNLHITVDAYRTTRDFEDKRYAGRYSFEKVK